MLFYNSMIFFKSLLLFNSFNVFWGNISSICFNSFALSEILKSFIALTCSFVCSLKALACSIIFFWLEGKVSRPVRY